jgi:hypothetical protein
MSGHGRGPSERTTRLWQRLERAYFHLETLKEAQWAYVRSGPYDVVSEVNRETGECVFRLQVLKEPPVTLSHVVGDCVHNLRSTLDHLAWELARLHGQPSRPRGIAFPIFEVEDGLQYSFRKKGIEMIAEVLPAAHPEIEALQPYHRWQDPKDHPLWILHELWNIDKHREIHLLGMLAKKSELAVTPMTIGGRVEDVEALAPRFEDGAVLGRCRLVPPDIDVKHEGQQTIFIVFDPRGPARGDVALDVLFRIHKYVHDEVLPRFERFFL